MKIISFEGFEFSGKSTQIKLLQNYFKKNKIKSTFTREPGGNKQFEKIRKISNTLKSVGSALSSNPLGTTLKAEETEIDEGIRMSLVKAIDKTKPGPLTRRGRIRDRLVRSEIKSAAEKNKKKRFSGLAASEKASKADKYMSPSSKTTASESFDIEESAAWTRKAGKNKEGGLNEKGRKSYERENPGSDLKAPSKKVGNPRRASFCARMKGMKKKLTSSKTANDPNSRINKSLRAWNC